LEKLIGPASIPYCVRIGLWLRQFAVMVYPGRSHSGARGAKPPLKNNSPPPWRNWAISFKNCD